MPECVRVGPGDSFDVSAIVNHRVEGYRCDSFDKGMVVPRSLRGVKNVQMPLFKPKRKKRKTTATASVKSCAAMPAAVGVGSGSLLLLRTHATDCGEMKISSGQLGRACEKTVTEKGKSAIFPPFAAGKDSQRNLESSVERRAYEDEDEETKRVFRGVRSLGVPLIRAFASLHHPVSVYI